MNLENIKVNAIPILRQFNVRRAGVFGSVARGEASQSSDVDILVDLDERASLFDVIDLKLRLEEAIGGHVDVVEYDMLKPLLRERILREQVILL